VEQEGRAGMPASPPDTATLEHFLVPARFVIVPDEWDTELDAGRVLTREQAVTLLADAAFLREHPSKLRTTLTRFRRTYRVLAARFAWIGGHAFS
jgi:hypothetical protein